MRPSLMLLSLVALAALAVPTPPAAAGYDYVAPGTFSVPGFRSNMALCDASAGTCLGGATFSLTGIIVIAAADDDLTGSEAPVLLCVWHPASDQTCGKDDAVSGPGCGPRLVFAPPGATRGVAYLYTLHVGETLEACGATRGTLHIVQV